MATHRRFRFSLRTLLIFATIAAALFGWLGQWAYKARQQCVAVAAIKKAGGAIGYDYYFRNMDGPSGWPKWLVDAVGVDYFASVQAVRLTGPRARYTGTELEHVRTLAKLKSLVLFESPIADSDLKKLQDLSELEVLQLEATGITDAGLEHLNKLRAVKFLDLRNTKVTDDGLKHLYRMTALEDVLLTKTRVTKEGIEQLQQALPHCQIYPFYRAAVPRTNQVDRPKVNEPATLANDYKVRLLPERNGPKGADIRNYIK